MRTLSLSLLSTLTLVGCGSTVVRLGDDGGAAAVDRPPVVDAAPTPPIDAPPVVDAAHPLDAPVVAPDVPLRPGALDLLLVIDNSNSMADRQLRLARALPALITSLGAPSSPRPVRDVHLGVVSTDVGTGGRAVPGCVNPDGGDDGRLNPIRSGDALRAHPPWTTLPPGTRPARCTEDPRAYPAFLTFDARPEADAGVGDDLLCNALLSTGGCGLEQPLEAAYRALVTHRGDASQGFVRDDAVLAIVVLTDEEDGSVRDCRYAEPGDPDGDCATRGDARAVFETGASGWSSPDLNLRFYRYAPGSTQDPTWSLSRYVDPSRAARGFTGLKPGHPERVVFGALTGVPSEFSRALDPTEWTGLLGAQPDGSDGYVGMSAEGLVSMRQANDDGACGARVVPACREQGGAGGPASCDARQQPFAWPARRVAEVARRFDLAWGNGVVGSICGSDYGDFVRRLTEAIRRRVGG